MTDVTATEASRNFSDLLDAIEQGGDEFTILRKGRPVARLSAPARSNGAAVRRLLAQGPPDDDWADDLRDLREFIGYEGRG
tara:strand:+ start:267 stop:509 length:243 start_codon:yes stop_codon:yes gene_type:complete